jgi:hypothetical protein
MNKTLKKFAIAILAAGATVAATRAPAAVTTNMQVLDNISVQLKVYSQGALKTGDKTLVATATTLTTSDLIQQLLIIGGFPTTTYKSDKLVVSTLYSNVVYGTVATTNGLFTNTISPLNTGTNLYVIDAGADFLAGGTNLLPITSGLNSGGAGFTNGYIISNNFIYAVTYTGAGVAGGPFFYDEITNDTIYTVVSASTTLAGNAAPPGAGTTTVFTNTDFPTTSGGTVGDWVTIVPTVTSLITNVVITQYSPTTATIFTNVSPRQYCVMTPKTAGSFTLYDVSDWISSDGDSTTIYNESGTDLSETDFYGTNISAQTKYSIDGLNVKIVYGTNGSPASQTNIIINPSGFAKATTKIANLVMGGTSKDKLGFQILSSENVTAAGQGSIGGSFVPDGNADGFVYTNTVTGVTNTPTIEPGGNLYFANGTAFTTNNIGTNTISATPVVVDGTITVSYLSAGAVVVPVEP